MLNKNGVKSSAAPARAAEAARSDVAPRTLAIDVGGSHIKAAVLDSAAVFVGDRVRVETPDKSPPEQIVDLIVKLVEPLSAFDRVSVGFPGAVRGGVVLTAPNLHHDGWTRFDLARTLGDRLGKPARVLNDADMQGLGAVRGLGLEMVITLGTGFGTALYDNGRLLPHLEISHLRFRKGQTYDDQLGNAARKRVGDKKWGKRVRRAVSTMRTLTNFDHLYIGGGNAKHLAFEPTPDITIISNDAGIAGGVAAWRD
jgi:polyphosphate glucokinase